MKLYNKKVERTYFQTDSFECEFSLLLDLVEELESADGLFSSVISAPSSVIEFLIENGFADTTTRGGFYGTDKLPAFREQLEKLEVGT